MTHDAIRPYRTRLGQLGVGTGIALLMASAPAQQMRMIKCQGADGKVSYQDKTCSPGARLLSEQRVNVPAPSARKLEKKPIGPLLIPQQLHAYRTSGSINGSATRFLVDTGATGVAVPEAFAASVNMKCEAKGKGMTAAGMVDTCHSTIAELSFGPYTLTNVPAAILSGLSEPLLGMSVLQHFHIEQEAGVMRITLKP